MAEPVVILDHPQMAENMGMTARAMMNCGLHTLRLVSPHQDHLSEKAIRAASGADTILQNAEVFADLPCAIADLTNVYGTTGRARELQKPIYSATDIPTLMGQKTGLLFGCERTGLTNEAISLCDGIITIPLNPEHTSLNLAQAVLLIGYEYIKTKEKLKPSTHQPTTKKNWMTFLDFLDSQLNDYYYAPEKEERMKQNLHSLLGRMQPDETEIKTLYGLVKHLRGKP